MSKGNLIIVSGPSGSGKDTILAELFKLHPDIEFSISNVTRKRREGEGDKYHFISKEEFLKLLQDDMMLEYNEYLGNYYGTPRQPVEKAIESGRDIIVEIDVNGAENIKTMDNCIAYKHCRLSAVSVVFEGKIR